VITPFAIGGALVELDGQAAENQAAFAACGGLDKVTAAQWKAFYGAYEDWSASVHDFLSHTLTIVAAPLLAAQDLAAIGDQMLSYQTQMNEWTDTANASCGGRGTKNVPGKGLGLSTAEDVIKDLTILAGVVGVVYVAVTLLPKRR